MKRRNLFRAALGWAVLVVLFPWRSPAPPVGVGGGSGAGSSTPAAVRVYNIDDFGGRGDGTNASPTDNAGPYLRCYLTCVTNGGGIIQFGKGTYRANEPSGGADVTGCFFVTNSGITIRGMGRGVTTLKPLATVAGDVSTLHIGNKPGSSNNYRVRNVTVRDLRIEGGMTERGITGTGDLEGIDIFTADFVRIEHVDIYDAAGDGVDMQFCYWGYIADCTATKIGGNPWSFQGTYAFANKLYATNGCIFNGSGDEDGGCFNITGTTVFISDCVSISNRVNLSVLSSSDVYVANSIFANPVAQTVPFARTNVWIRDSSFTAVNTLFFNQDAAYNVFANNSFCNISASKFYGVNSVQLANIGSGTIQNNRIQVTSLGVNLVNASNIVVSGNSFIQAPSRSIQLGANCHNFLAQNNTFDTGAGPFLTASGSTNFVFEGNVHRGLAANYAVDVESGSKGRLSHNYIIGTNVLLSTVQSDNNTYVSGIQIGFMTGSTFRSDRIGTIDDGSNIKGNQFWTLVMNNDGTLRSDVVNFPTLMSLSTSNAATTAGAIITNGIAGLGMYGTNKITLDGTAGTINVRGGSASVAALEVGTPGGSQAGISFGNNGLYLFGNGTPVVWFRDGSGVNLDSATPLGWSSSSSDPATSRDVTFSRLTAGQLKLDSALTLTNGTLSITNLTFVGATNVASSGVVGEIPVIVNGQTFYFQIRK